MNDMTPAGIEGVAEGRVQPGSALATIETTNFALIFVPGGVDDILTRIKHDARQQAAALDISTERGRKAIRSLAHKVARSKTALDGAGAELKAEWLAKSNAIDAERRTIRADLDALKAEISKPVDDYEAAIEAKRKANEDAVAAMESLTTGLSDLASADIADRQTQLAIVAEFDWAPEFIVRASRVRDGVAAQLVVAHGKAQEREAEAAAEAQRAAEEAERQRLAAVQAQKEREERIAAEAAETARLAAEAKAAREAEERAAAVLATQQETERLAQAERDAAARALAAAAERDRRAEERRIAEHRAAIEAMRRLSQPLEPPDPVSVIDAKSGQLKDIFDNRQWEEFADEADAVCRASRSTLASARDAAVALAAKQEADRAEAQRQRDDAARIMAEARARQELAEQQRLEQVEAERREANIAHRRKVNGEAATDFIAALEQVRVLIAGCADAPMEAIAKAIVTALAKNEIRHCRIGY